MTTSMLLDPIEFGPVARRLAQRPRIASVALALLQGPLANSALTAPSNPTLATSIWRRANGQYGFTGYALRPLAYAVYQRYLSEKPIDLAEEFSFLTLHPGAEYPQRAQVDQALLASEIDLAASGLVDAWCDRLARYWSEPQEDGRSFWNWLAHHLRGRLAQARELALANGSLSLKEGTWIDQALALPSAVSQVRMDDRRVRAQVLLEDQAPIPRILISTDQAVDGCVLYSPLQGFSRFADRPALEAHLGRALSEVEREGAQEGDDLFSAWARGILDRHLVQLRELASTLRQQRAEAALFEARMDDFPAATLLDHASHLWRSQAIGEHLPAWLRQASDAQRLRYADGLKALIAARARRKDSPFIEDIPRASQFARQRLIAEAALMHPEAPLSEPDDVVIHIYRRDDDALLSIAGGASNITLTEQQISLVELSLVNVGGRPPGWMGVGPKSGKTLPAWLDKDAVLDLVTRANVGATYLTFLKAHLSQGSEADRRRQTYRVLAAIQLPLLALELQLRHEKGFDERGVALVRRVFAPDALHSSVTVTQLALQAARDLPADPVTGSFLFSDPATSDVVVLYAPLGLEPLRQFSSRQTLMDCILTQRTLQQAVLNGLSETARPRYTHGGLEAPRWARFGLGDEFAPLPSPEPALLAERPIEGTPLNAFYASVVEVVTRTADRQTVSNWESFWISAQQVAWLVFNQLLPLASGTSATAAWLIQLSHAIEAHYNDTAQFQGGEVPEDFDTQGILVDLMLALITESLHLGLRRVPALEGLRPLEQGVAENAAQGPVLNTRWSASDAQVTSAMREQLAELTVAAPPEPRQPATEGPHQGLYAERGRWLAPVGHQWFEVNIVQGDVKVVDPTGAGRQGPWLRPGDHGQWQFDLRLRLRGGGPKRRLEQQRQENQRLRTEASQHLVVIETRYRQLQEDGDRVERQIKADLDLGRVDQAKALHVSELARVEAAYAAIHQARLDYETIHAKVALPDYQERLAMAVAAEINTCGYYLALNRQALNFFLKAHPDFADVLRDGLPMTTEQRSLWFEFLEGYVVTAETGVSWRTRLETAMGQLEMIPIHGARWLERLRPKFVNYRPLIEYQALRLYTHLSLLDAPMVDDEVNLDLFHQAMKPLVLALNTHKQLALDTTLSSVEAKELLDGVVSAYQASEEMVQLLKHSLRPEYVSPGMDQLKTIIGELRSAAEDCLGQMVTGTSRQTPAKIKPALTQKEAQRVIRTRNRGKLFARVRKKPGHPAAEIAEVVSPLDDRVVARFEPDETGGDWVERAVPTAPRPHDTADINRLARMADRRLEDAARQLAQAPRLAQATHIPIELEELMLATSHELNGLAEKIERKLTRMNETDVAVEHVQSAENKVHALRAMAGDIKREGRALRIRLTKMGLPTVARVRYLVDQGAARIRKLGGRVPLKGTGKRKDIIQEYVVEELNGTPLWYAHFHYADQDAADEEYLAAHLKTATQRFVGLSQQMAQAADNAEVVKVYRSRIDLQSARTLFLNQP